MYQFDEKEVLQAILIADNNVESLSPFSDNSSTALLPLVNVAMLDYALEALNRSGVEEVFIYSILHQQTVRDHVKAGIDMKISWSINMTVHVIGGEGSRGFGDAMRDLDAKALIRSNFIVLGADTVTNADLRAIFEQHKKTMKYDKGAVATLVYKEATNSIRSGSEVMIVMDKQNNRLHYHRRLKTNSKEANFEIPLEIFMHNSQTVLLHNLLDPSIAIGSPAMLSLFSDNFDFETRDDFVRGVIMNEELLNSRIYISVLPSKQYARKVTNWLSYQIVSQDIINRWAFPLVPDMNIYYMKQQTTFLRNNIYKSSKAILNKALLRENVVVQAGSSVAAGSTLANSVLGENCNIGGKCRLNNAYLMNGVTVKDGCVLEFCVIGKGALIAENCTINEGAVIGENCSIPANTKISKNIVRSTPFVADNEEVMDKLGEKAFVIKESIADKSGYSSNESDDEAEDTHVLNCRPRMRKIPLILPESDYESQSSNDEESEEETPALDDTKIFLSEVMDSLTRGYKEKTNPDFLILEINSSRYAYNMSLKEVNFNVVKAVFSLAPIRQPENGNILLEVKTVLKQLGAVILNYIKNESAMLDCLKALEDIYDENPLVREKFAQIIHYLYDKDYVSEDAILEWYNDINMEKHSSLKKSCEKFIAWLEQSSEEEDSD